jgi:ketosteroid isomerase-like protein
MDAASFAGLFAPDGTLTFANTTPLVGTEAIVAGCNSFLGTIRGLHHTILKEWHVGDDHIVELSVTYDRHDGRHVTIPCVSIWTTNTSGLIVDYRVFFDLAPVYA